MFPCGLFRNGEKILGYLNSNVLSHDLIPPHVNFSQLSTVDYAEIYGVIKTVKEGSFAELSLDPCVLEDELNKVQSVCLVSELYLTQTGSKYEPVPQHQTN